MTRLVFDLDADTLGERASGADIPVLLYGSQPPFAGAGIVGHDLCDKFERLSVPPSTTAIDLVSIAMAVTAADNFVLRDDAADGWRREIELDIPLAEPERWIAVERLLAKTLGFLSGDSWTFNFRTGGFRPPSKQDVRRRVNYADPSKVDCVALFSGGLDSAIGALNLLDQGLRPLLVSHAGTGDSSYQQKVASFLPNAPQRFDFNSYPSRAFGVTEISSRTRSFQFLAVGAMAAHTVGSFRGKKLDLLMCENGLIALNPPLTARRIGSHSTRTAHPHYLALIRELLAKVELEVGLANPYRFQTKGHMLKRLSQRADISTLASSTISCGHWKRKGQQCGRCVPCLIRRASFLAAGVSDDTSYQSPLLKEAQANEEFRDDIVSVHSALRRRYDRDFKSWILQAGPLPAEATERAAYFKVAEEGMDELEAFYSAQGLPV